MAKTAPKKPTKSASKTTARTSKTKPAKNSAKAAKKKAATKKAPKVKKQVVKKIEPSEAQTPEHVGKIQCLSVRKKVICAHLLLADRKCSVKTIGHGRLATVRVGKKRRCELYEETEFAA